MELDNLVTAESHESGAEINIVSPVDGQMTDVFITIKGVDSRTWRQVKKEQTREIINARADGKMDSLDYDLMDAKALATSTVSWRGIVKDGKEYECNYDNALALYKDAPSVVAQ